MPLQLLIFLSVSSSGYGVLCHWGDTDRCPDYCGDVLLHLSPQEVSVLDSSMLLYIKCLLEITGLNIMFK